jgi:small subunit ribosomal protein S13
VARISGVDLPREKRVEIGLDLYLWHRSDDQPAILRETGIDPDTRVRDLTEEEVVRLREYIDREPQGRG